MHCFNMFGSIHRPVNSNRYVHVDAQYASAVFLYQRQFAERYQKYCSYVFMDDKHHCEVREPSNPVAAVDRCKRVIVSLDHKFVVADQDHTKCSIVPSVAMVCNIPQSIDESFYCDRFCWHQGLYI